LAPYAKHQHWQFERSAPSLYRNAGVTPRVAPETYAIPTVIALAAAVGVTLPGESVARHRRIDVVLCHVKDATLLASLAPRDYLPPRRRPRKPSVGLLNGRHREQFSSGSDISKMFYINNAKLSQ
jgi:hypothetical protein